jgi:hypothetical protein
MNFKVVKRTAISLALSGTFLLGSAAIVSAQNWQRVYRPIISDNRPTGEAMRVRGIVMD